jgi:hypothetical protein
MPITLDESSTSCFVLSGSEPNLLNRGLSPISLDESSTSPLIVCSLVGLISILTEFEANHFYVFIVANPVTMLDNALAILRGGKTSSLNREMEKHYLSDPGIIRSWMNKQCPVI